MNEIELLKSELNKSKEIADEKSSQVMAKFRSKADKLIRDVERRFVGLQEDGNSFKEVITPETNVMDKYSNKIYEEIQNTIENINPPSKITHKSLETYLKTIRDQLGALDKILIKYVKLLKSKKYGRRVKTLSGTLKRMHGSIRILENFVKVEYGPSSEIETASVLIEETLELIESFQENYIELESKEDEVKTKISEIQELRVQLSEYVNHPSKIALETAIDNFGNAQREIDHAFSNVRKVLRKYGKVMAKSGKIDSALISDLVTDAATTMGKLSNSSSLQSLLVDLDESLSNPIMNLNKDKRDTAKDDIQKLLSGDLDKYYTRASEIFNEKKDREKELLDLELASKIDQLEHAIAGTERDKSRVYQREYRLLLDLTDSINNNVSEIRDTIANLTITHDSIEIALPELPEWVESGE